MAYRNKTYVAFDGDKDIHYYNLMKAWKSHGGLEFNFHDAHDVNSARDESKEESIKAQLAERMRNSKIFVLLVGESTRYLTKFVRWEMEQALKRGLPIVVVNLNSARKRDDERCPPLLRDELAIHVSFNMKIIAHALDNWPASEQKHRENGDDGAYFYPEKVYEGLDL